MVSSATAYSVTMKVQDLHASKSEGHEKEGSFHELLISETAGHIPHVLDKRVNGIGNAPSNN